MSPQYRQYNYTVRAYERSTQQQLGKPGGDMWVGGCDGLVWLGASAVVARGTKAQAQAQVDCG